MKSFLKLLFVGAAILFVAPALQSADLPVVAVTAIGAYTVITGLVLPYVNTGILGLNGTNNFTARESFRMARQMFYEAMRDKFPDGTPGDIKCRKWADSLVLTQGEIRLEVQLNAVNNIFTFGVTPNQANTNNVVFPTERRLPLQDSICATEMAIYVCKPTSQTATTHLLRTYGNTQDFTAAAAAALDSTFYSHGDFTIKVNNEVIVPYRGLANFWYKPQTQQTALLGAGAPGDQVRLVEDAACTCEPNIVLIGSKNSIPQIELPTNMATVDEFTRAVIIYKGPYAQNSTVVN